VQHGPAPLEAHDEYWMQIALGQADVAASHRDVPIGAVVVHESGLVLGLGENRREIDSDPTAHAEVLALRRACQQRGHWRLHDAVLYVTLEPCAMCAGALVNARISRVVFGASDAKAGALGSLYQLGDDARLNHRFPSRSNVLAEACRDRLQAFFRALRALGEK
jgi:tRNA(adenine34) deaminase